MTIYKAVLEERTTKRFVSYSSEYFDIIYPIYVHLFRNSMDDPNADVKLRAV